MGDFKKINRLVWLLPLVFVLGGSVVFLTGLSNQGSSKSIDQFEAYFFDSEKGDYVNLEIKSGGYNDLGFLADTVILKIPLSHPGFSNTDLIEISNPTFDITYLSYVDDQGNEIENLLALDNGVDFFYPNPVFPLPRYRDSSNFLEFKILSSDPFRFSLSTYRENTFLKKSTQTLALVAIYCGIMLALVLYNFFLFFIVQDRGYLYYFLYILFIGMAQISLLGYSYLFFFQESKTLYQVSIIIFSSLSGIFGVLFIQNFLKTKNHVPKLNKVLTGIAILYGFGSMARVLGLVEISYSITDLAGLMVVVFFITVAFIVANKNYKPAEYFLLAWAFFLVGLFSFIMHNTGLIYLGTFPSLPMLLGTAMEAILLSLALAYRINVLKQEKDREQSEKLRLMKEAEILILRQNEMLEEKVRRRTEELEETLHDLQQTQTQLVNQEKMASLGQLTAGIAHEINNPINFVSSNISPLKRDIKDVLELMEAYREKGKLEFSEAVKRELESLEDDLEFDYLLTEIDQLLKGMEDGAKRTVEIVKGLKIFSRVDEQDVKRVDLHDGLDSTLVLLNNTINDRIEIEKNYGDIPMVECLAGKINQVFMNILSNAVHAIFDHPEEGRAPKIVISTQQEGDTVKITIKDNGPGIPESIQNRIFEPFFTTKPVGKGTGLGLSIVYTIIENHKGKLALQSKEGEGSQFTIVLPVSQGQSA
ncbi:two-component sensor histidine kinase [Indibacter alkaliphilus LW1]|uniref:histidine kinase n=1 Tax=Indibacter alkaliphilus (strain CCUG 57479 / KCTC 22604 / LW1) TaxID=1189612 RepID=S2DA79_INDAL|nr:7TM diverse intracellular signaling domain-containing protein [Indibacter alkaliphilus]EOZ95834.1 two-component sensor histidine kinase [Indibacter alkaliphilus LW1]